MKIFFYVIAFLLLFVIFLTGTANKGIMATIFRAFQFSNLSSNTSPGKR
ncbi:hypothetical protein JJB07_07440 [Tumebacillus sp. ITR2]|uniref:Uncharacterized protein n=1 Tax=Tumebacillus amylolyticus TaxID=2801339 RepID=A0ABS1J875_9BACL|nr:hypothetical protein [Tumebacillus amylolyticus]MBL0386478.1 hypothetical protein [Tumebacillus amylolyticus]